MKGQARRLRRLWTTGGGSAVLDSRLMAVAPHAAVCATRGSRRRWGTSATGSVWQGRPKLPSRWIDDRVCQTSVRNLTERIPPNLGLVAVAGWTGLVPTRRASRTYLNLYFSLERTEDLELLTWLYALPVSRRGAGIKRVLRAGLAAFLHEQYPDRSPLSHAAVRDVVAT